MYVNVNKDLTIINCRHKQHFLFVYFQRYNIYLIITLCICIYIYTCIYINTYIIFIYIENYSNYSNIYIPRQMWNTWSLFVPYFIKICVFVVFVHISINTIINIVAVQHIALKICSYSHYLLGISLVSYITIYYKYLSWMDWM